MEKFEKLKILREETNMSISECNKALLNSKNDLIIARDLLKKKMEEIGEKKSLKKTNFGVFGSYTHFSGTLLSILELHSETDFVAKNPEFKNLANELATQIIYSTNIKYISELNIPESEKFCYNEDILNEILFLRQPFYKDESISIKNLLNQYSAKFGEKIEIVAFYKFQIK